jgi:hypothetical protein
MGIKTLCEEHLLTIALIKLITYILKIHVITGDVNIVANEDLKSLILNKKVVS